MLLIRFPPVVFLLLTSYIVCAANVILKNPYPPSKKSESKNFTDDTKTNLLATKQDYIVQEGDTLFGIARMYETSHVKIMEENNMQEGDVIKIGQSLAIPQTFIKSSKAKNQEKKNIKIQESDGSHIVRDGETLFGIARMYNVSPIDLATENGVDLTDMLKIGQIMKVPSKNSSITPENNVPETKIITQENLQRNIRDKLNGRKINCEHSFGWPVYSTEVLYGYGEMLTNGTNLDGVIIASEINKNVVASYSGEVAYVGDDIPEYGKLMIVKHKNNWMTIYGYMNAYAKKVGDKVTKGDLLGAVGHTGDADGPSLYFSIRKVKTPYNPELCI